MSVDKKIGRKRRSRKIRDKIRRLGVPRLSVYRSSKHIYAQIIMPGGKVIASASTLDKDIMKDVGYGGNIAAAILVGEAIALRSIKAGVKKAAFDRSGFIYHGRIAALGNAARKKGLEF